MKKTLSIVAASVCFAACKTRPGKPPSSPPAGFISIDSANKMVQSYLATIEPFSIDSDIRSVTFNANDLRYLLDSQESSKEIVKVQIRLAHTLKYINDGHAGEPAGYKSGALTFLISGVDEHGNAINAKNMILNYAKPCPSNCPAGTAGNPLY